MESNPMRRVQNGGSAVATLTGKKNVPQNLGWTGSAQCFRNLTWEFLELRLCQGPGQYKLFHPLTHRWKLLVRVCTQNSVLWGEMSTSDNFETETDSIMASQGTMLSVFQAAAMNASALCGVDVTTSKYSFLKEYEVHYLGDACELLYWVFCRLL